MEKFIIRYHIVGNKVITDVKEFENFGVAVIKTARMVEENERIAITKNGSHVYEIKTEYITHHEVLTEEEAKRHDVMRQIGNMVSPLRN